MLAAYAAGTGNSSAGTAAAPTIAVVILRVQRGVFMRFTILSAPVVAARECFVEAYPRQRTGSRTLAPPLCRGAGQDRDQSHAHGGANLSPPLDSRGAPTRYGTAAVRYEATVTIAAIGEWL